MLAIRPKHSAEYCEAIESVESHISIPLGWPLIRGDLKVITAARRSTQTKAIPMAVP
jgi:hypothetical protein